MQKGKRKKEPIPEEFRSIEEASNFWDTHDIADYWDETKEVKFEVEVPKESCYVALEKEIAREVLEVAKEKHVSVETLINLWLKEKLVHSV